MPQSFHTTRWSLIVRAGRDSSPQARTALEDLCRLYWYPLYAFVRREGIEADEAQDLTQSFFAALLERDDLRDVSPERGKFRAFLRSSMKHFLLNHWRDLRREKRGGGRRVLPLDYGDVESRFARESAEEVTPDRLYDRQWALTLLDLALHTVESEYRDHGKARLFTSLRPYLTGVEAAVPYPEIAGELELTEGAVRTAMHRLRKDFGRELRRQAADTLDEHSEPDEEIRLLFEALRSG